MREQNIGTSKQMPGEREGCLTPVRYQAVCSISQEGGYCTYGLQCLEARKGAWVQLDLIEDVSPCRDSVLRLVSLFNALQLSPLHFRDAVLDSVSA